MQTRRSHRRPLGLELRFLWGEARVGEFFMRPGGPAAFTVGSGAGVDFPMGDKRLGAPRFEVVRRDAQGFELRFTQAMKGTITRRGAAHTLEQAVDDRLAQADGEGFCLALEPDDVASVDLGGVRVEAFFQPVPNPVFAALAERIDYPALNIFLAVFFLGAVGVISAENKADAAEAYADELDGPPAEIKQMQVRLDVKPPNGFVDRLRAKKMVEPASPAAHEGAEGKAGDKKAVAVNRRASPAGNPADPDRSRNLIRGLFKGPGGAAGAIFDGNGLGGELKTALGGVTGAVFGSARGLEGMGLRGVDSGGGGTERTAGIGRLVTRGRGNGERDYGESAGLPSSSKDHPKLPPQVDGVVVVGYDRELVREVIHAHRGQIRYCYEDQLSRYPALAGKVAVRFTIGAMGTVGSSDVAQTTVNNAPLEACVASRVRSWVFPKPKTGGAVVVTYPFLFKPSGE